MSKQDQEFVNDMRNVGVKEHEDRRASLWTGPCGGGPNGGVTFSMMSRWLCCRERFRIMTVEGLKPADRFCHRREFGNLWHVCEEALAGCDVSEYDKMYWCQQKLKDAVSALCRQYPMQQQEVDKWYNVIRIQFPLYVKFWQGHPDVKNREPLLSEQVFDVPYRLPSGRTVRLRGKWDSVDLVNDGKNTGVWLMENKSKGEIREQEIKQQLHFDLQTCTYLVALERYKVHKSNTLGHHAIKGVRYNVIRRPLSGGKGTIVPKKATAGSKCPKCKGVKDLSHAAIGRGSSVPCDKCSGTGRTGGKPAESKDAYWKRVAKYLEDSPQEYFMRWNVEVSQPDVTRFRRECLDPVLESMCDDAEWWMDCKEKCANVWSSVRRKREFPHHSAYQYRLPFGIWNIVAEGGRSELDDYLRTGSEVGLTMVDNLFPELQNA